MLIGMAVNRIARQENHPMLPMDIRFGPLVECCRAHGIGRSVAFQLAEKGLLDTFKIGARRMVVLESLYALPSKLRGQGAANADRMIA